MEAKKIFHRNGLIYSRIEVNKYLAGYCVSQDTRIMYYQILAIDSGHLIFNDDRRIMTLTIFKYQWDIQTRKIFNLLNGNEMEPKSSIDLQHLCEKIQSICPDNSVEFTGDGLILNGTLVKMSGPIVIYQNNKARVTSLFELVRLLKTDRILKCTLQDLTYLSTSPSTHSHTIK
jgi:hypothetical protein